MKSERAERHRAAVLDVPVDREALEEAFELNARGVRSYLHRITGTVLRVVEGMAEPGLLTRIAADDDYLRIEPVSSRVQYTWMEEYIPTVESPNLKRDLGKAIQGKGAFRRFKDVLLDDEAEQERWFAFRSERMGPIVEAWLDAHGLNPVGAPIQVPAASGRSARSVKDIRQSLYELADALGPRDLQTLVAFAESVRARSIRG